MRNESTVAPRFQHGARNRPRNTPARFLFIFLAAFASITVITTIQERHRRAIESTQAPTALGDSAYFELKRPADFARPLILLEQGSLRAIPLFLQDDSPVERDDRLLRKVAWPRQRYYIYRDPAENDEGRYYLKIGRNQYLTVGPKPKTPTLGSP